MVSFNGLNFNNVGMPMSTTAPAVNFTDAYEQLSEKKDNFVAVMIANDNKTDKRASATVIAANFSAMVACVKAGINILRKGKAYKNPLTDWFMNGANTYINFMNKHNIGRNPLHNKVLGYGTYIIGSTLLGAGLGFIFDWYNTARNTIINGKISNTKSGVNGSWIQSGLKSLSSTEEGKELIKNSIHKNKDKSITVKFSGINKEYTITKQELKEASRSYVTYLNDNGGKVRDFKKKFSKGDGDVLAFELAFEKYCKDVNNGAVKEDKILPKTMQSVSDTGDILFANGSANQLYYLLTGKSIHYDTKDPSNDAIMKMYSQIGVNRFKEDLPQNPKSYACEIMLGNNSQNNIIIRDKFRHFKYLKADKKYTVTDVDDKYITLVNSEKTKESYILPIKKVNNYISTVDYVKPDDKKGTV